MEDDTGLLRTGGVMLALDHWALTDIYRYLSQCNGRLFNDALWTHGEQFLDRQDFLYSCRMWSWAKGPYNDKDTRTNKESIGQTQEHHRATEWLIPNLSTNRMSSAIKGNKIGILNYFSIKNKRRNETHLQVRKIGPCGNRQFDDIWTLFHFSSSLFSDWWWEDKQSNMIVCVFCLIWVWCQTHGFCAKENAFVLIHDYILNVLCHRESNQ